MKKIYIFVVGILSLVLGCAKDDSDKYEYSHSEIFKVQEKKYFFFYRGTDVRSSTKGYAVDLPSGVTDTIPSIQGFDDIYKEGKRYVISVDVYRRTKDLLDDVYPIYKLKKILVEENVK